MPCAYTSSKMSVTKEMLQFEHSGEHTLSNPRSGTIGLKLEHIKIGCVAKRMVLDCIFMRFLGLIYGYCNKIH